MAKHKLKDLGKKIGGEVKHFTTHNPLTGVAHSLGKKLKIQGILDKGKEAALTALFLPYLPLAYAYLLRRKITPDKNPTKVLKQVFIESKKKNYGLLGSGDSFDVSLSEYGLATDTTAPLPSDDFKISGDIVTTTLSFLKGIFDTVKKKQAGAAAAIAAGKSVPPEDVLTPDEQKVIADAPKIEAGIEAVKDKAIAIASNSEDEAAKEAETGEGVLDGSVSIGGKEISKKVILAVVLLLVILIFLMRRR